MAGAQMRLEIEHFLEIVRANLNAGFANFVRRFGRRMPPPFGDSNPQRPVGAPQLTRQGEAGEAAASDKNIHVHEDLPMQIIVESTGRVYAFSPSVCAPSMAARIRSAIR
jgi:hypothetical protein